MLQMHRPRLLPLFKFLLAGGLRHYGKTSGKKSALRL